MPHCSYSVIGSQFFKHIAQCTQSDIIDGLREKVSVRDCHGVPLVPHSIHVITKVVASQLRLHIQSRPMILNAKLNLHSYEPSPFTLRIEI